MSLLQHFHCVSCTKARQRNSRGKHSKNVIIRNFDPSIIKASPIVTEEMTRLRQHKLLRSVWQDPLQTKGNFKLVLYNIRSFNLHLSHFLSGIFRIVIYLLLPKPTLEVHQRFPSKTFQITGTAFMRRLNMVCVFATTFPLCELYKSSTTQQMQRY